MNSFNISITDCTQWRSNSSTPLAQAQTNAETITRIELGPIKQLMDLTPPSYSLANSVLIHQENDLKHVSTAKLSRVSVLLSASDGHSLSLLQQNRMKQLRHLDRLCELAREQQISVRCYLMCAFSCPIEGQTSAHDLTDICAKLIRFGCEDVILVDNEGSGNREDLMAIFNVLSAQLPKKRTGFYFSTNNPQTPSMIKFALENGINKFCASRNDTFVIGSNTQSSMTIDDLLANANP